MAPCCPGPSSKKQYIRTTGFVKRKRRKSIEGQPQGLPLQMQRRRGTPTRTKAQRHKGNDSDQQAAVSVNIHHRTHENLSLYCPIIGQAGRPRSKESHNATRATMISPTPATEPLRHHRGVSTDWGRGDRPVAPTDFVRRRVSDTGPRCQSAKSAPLCGQPQGLPLQTQTRRAMACGFMGTPVARPVVVIGVCSRQKPRRSPSA